MRLSAGGLTRLGWPVLLVRDARVVAATTSGFAMLWVVRVRFALRPVGAVALYAALVTMAKTTSLPTGDRSEARRIIAVAGPTRLLPLAMSADPELAAARRSDGLATGIAIGVPGPDLAQRVVAKGFVLIDADNTAVLFHLWCVALFIPDVAFLGLSLLV